jgi:enoyl-[acyl-carrier protein] reductase II
MLAAMALVQMVFRWVVGLPRRWKSSAHDNFKKTILETKEGGTQLTLKEFSRSVDKK